MRRRVCETLAICIHCGKQLKIRFWCSNPMPEPRVLEVFRQTAMRQSASTDGIVALFTHTHTHKHTHGIRWRHVLRLEYTITVCFLENQPRPELDVRRRCDKITGMRAAPNICVCVWDIFLLHANIWGKLFMDKLIGFICTSLINCYGCGVHETTTKQERRKKWREEKGTHDDTHHRTSIYDTFLTRPQRSNIAKVHYA